MDERDSSSTGLMIGMIAGGAVVVVLVVLGLGGLFFMGSAPAPDPGGPGPVMTPAPEPMVAKSATPNPTPEPAPVITSKPEPMVEIAKPPPQKPPVVEIAPPPTQKAPALDERFAQARDRLLGTWEAMLADGRQVELLFGADLTLKLTTKDAGRTTTHKGIIHWTITSEKDQQVTVRQTWVDDGSASQHDLLFAGNDRFTVRSEAVPGTGAPANLANVSLYGVVFQRKKELAK